MLKSISTLVTPGFKAIYVFLVEALQEVKLFTDGRFVPLHERFWGNDGRGQGRNTRVPEPSERAVKMVERNQCNAWQTHGT